MTRARARARANNKETKQYLTVDSDTDSLYVRCSSALSDSGETMRDCERDDLTLDEKRRLRFALYGSDKLLHHGGKWSSPVRPLLLFITRRHGEAKRKNLAKTIKSITRSVSSRRDASAECGINNYSIFYHLPRARRLP